MNTRKDNNGKALKAWRAIPPGHIAKPLRHIGDRTNAKGKEGQIIPSFQYLSAAAAARRGDGLYVQRLARSLP